MVRCGYVCYCMFNWLVGFRNLILLVDFRLFDWLDGYLRLLWSSGYLEHQHGLI